MKKMSFGALSVLAVCAAFAAPVAEEVDGRWQLTVPEGEYIVFEHGPFDYEQENRSVEEKIEKAMADFDYAANRFCLDTAPGRIMYFYYDPARYFKYIRPIKRT